MTVAHLTHAQLDKAQWDACVSASPQYMLYGLSWYLDAVSPGWEALVCQQGGRYVAVMPLPLRHRYGIRFVHQPLFCQFLDVYATQAIDKQLFVDALQKRLRLVRSLCVAYQAQGIESEERCTHILDLSQPYERLQSLYSADRLTNLRRAGSYAWRWVESTDPEPLIRMFASYHEQRIEGGIHPMSYQILRRLFAEVQRRGVGVLRYALSPEGHLEAGCWWVYSGKRIVYLFNAASPLGRRGNARTWLLDEFVKEHASQAYLLDFESPMIPSIAAFYRSFGAEPSPYWCWSYNRLPRWLNALWRLKKSLV